MYAALKPWISFVQFDLYAPVLTGAVLQLPTQCNYVLFDFFVSYFFILFFSPFLNPPPRNTDVAMFCTCFGRFVLTNLA